MRCCMLEFQAYRVSAAKEWSLGCVKRAPASRGDQDAGITQPRDNLYPIPVEWKTLLASPRDGSPRTHLTPLVRLSSSSDTLVIASQICIRNRMEDANHGGICKYPSRSPSGVSSLQILENGSIILPSSPLHLHLVPKTPDRHFAT